MTKDQNGNIISIQNVMLMVHYGWIWENQITDQLGKRLDSLLKEQKQIDLGNRLLALIAETNRGEK